MFYYCMSSSELISQYIQHKAHIHNLKPILKTIIFNIFKISILIADSFFTRSRIFHKIEFSTRSQVLLMILLFFCFLPAVTMSETSQKICIFTLLNFQTAVKMNESAGRMNDLLIAATYFQF